VLVSTKLPTFVSLGGQREVTTKLWQSVGCQLYSLVSFCDAATRDALWVIG
jgi:hypothetical protein